jgi:serine/threonine protein phosphatase PrpC
VNRLSVSSASETGKVRANNEDFAQVASYSTERGAWSVLAVADGVGGGPLGELASRMAVEVVLEMLASSSWDDPTSALRTAFDFANKRVGEVGIKGRTATTMVVAAISPDASSTIANVGDSRAYLISNGEALQITADHSLVAARVAAGQMTAAEARVSQDRNLLIRAIGSAPDVDVDIFGPRKLVPGERLVLCTDGVHGLIDDQAIARLASGPIQRSAAELVAAALDAGGTDNATAIVAGLEPQVHLDSEGARGWRFALPMPPWQRRPKAGAAEPRPRADDPGDKSDD